MLIQAVGFQDEVALARINATAGTPASGFPLVGGATRTLTSQCVAGYGNVSGYVFADVAGTLVIEQSIDGTTYDISTSIAVTAGVAITFDVPVYGMLARARYVNGANPQTLFRLNCVARASSGAATGSSSTPGTLNAGWVMQNSSAALGGGGTLLSAVFQVGVTTIGGRYTGYDIVRLGGQSDVVGTISVIQALAAADIVAPFTNCFRNDFGVPAGGNGFTGAQLIVAPFVSALYTNGAGAQTRMRFFAELQ